MAKNFLIWMRLVLRNFSSDGSIIILLVVVMVILLIILDLILKIQKLICIYFHKFNQMNLIQNYIRMYRQILISIERVKCFKWLIDWDVGLLLHHVTLLMVMKN